MQNVINSLTALGITVMHNTQIKHKKKVCIIAAKYTTFQNKLHQLCSFPSHKQALKTKSMREYLFKRQDRGNNVYTVVEAEANFL